MARFRTSISPLDSFLKSAFTHEFRSLLVTWTTAQLATKSLSAIITWKDSAACLIVTSTLIASGQTLCAAGETVNFCWIEQKWQQYTQVTHVCASDSIQFLGAEEDCSTVVDQISSENWLILRQIEEDFSARLLSLLLVVAEMKN